MTDNEFDWLNEDSLSSDHDNFDWLDDDYQLETDAPFDKAAVLSRRIAKREMRMAQKEQNLASIITQLPPEDTDLYLISTTEGREVPLTGRVQANGWDFGTFIPVLLNLMFDATGQTSGAELFVSTWIANMDFCRFIQQSLADGRIAAFHFLGDKFIKRRHSQSVYTVLTETVQAHAGSRLLLAPNHCKIVAASVGNRRVTVTGSANLSAAARTEQFNVSTSPVLFDFYVNEFFEVWFKQRSRQVMRGM